MTDRLPTVTATYVRGVIGPSPIGMPPGSGRDGRIAFALLRVDTGAPRAFSVRAVEFLAVDGTHITPGYPVPPATLQLLVAPPGGGVPAWPDHYPAQHELFSGTLSTGVTWLRLIVSAALPVRTPAARMRIITGEGTVIEGALAAGNWPTA